VESGDADLLALGSDVLGGQHGGVRRRFVSVGLDLHSTGDSGDGLLAREIGDVDEGVVEPGRQWVEFADKWSHARSEDVSNAKDVLTLGDLGAEGNSLLLGGSNFLGGLRVS